MKKWQLMMSIVGDLDLDIYQNERYFQNRLIKNAFVIHPMECNDANNDGTPSEYTHDRYKKFVKGGAGIVWFETIAVSEQGRTNVKQLMINSENIIEFKKLLCEVNKENKVICIAQLSHGGRYSISDEIYELYENLQMLDKQKEMYISSAKLAIEAGFDGIDLKFCHGFLMGDVLFNLGKYSYFNSYTERVNYIVNIISETKKRVGKGFIFAARIDISEFWSGEVLGFNELIYLINSLRKTGVFLYSFSIKEYYIKNENLGLDDFRRKYSELFHISQSVKKYFKDILIVSPGLTMYGPYIQETGKELLTIFDLIGFGRQALAYPDFVNDILNHKGLDKNRCCIMCGKCSDLRRKGQRVKCLK